MAYEKFSFDGFLKLKSMPRLKSLNLYYKTVDEGDYKEIYAKEIQNLGVQLPNTDIKISGVTY